MPLTRIPPGNKKPPTAMVEIGPIMLRPDVAWRSTYISDTENAEVYAFCFATGVTQPNGGQLKIVKDAVAPLLKNPDAYCEIYGCADRTGSNQVNFKVAGLRLANFQAALTMAGAPPKQVYASQHKNLGEEFAATYEEDEMADPTERLVLIYIWSNYMTSQRIYADKPFLKFARAF
jgi:outer membrane protein OmpA-like peptidoglycan-associated protein